MSEIEKNIYVSETKENNQIISDIKKYTVKISDEFITSDFMITIEILKI